MASSEIVNTGDIAGAEWDGRAEPGEVRTDMVATESPTGKGIEFNVSMLDYTMRDMEGLIVEAAARVIVGKYGNDKLAKLVEERCMALVTAKVDAHLAGVTAAIIDQPVTPKFPFMSKADEKPVTMREFIGLTGQAFLNARVDYSGNPTTDSYSSKPRMQHLVEKYMDIAFKREIEKATGAAIVEIRSAIEARHKEFLAAEKKRFSDALAKTTAQ